MDLAKNGKTAFLPLKHIPNKAAGLEGVYCTYIFQAISGDFEWTCSK